MHFTEILSGDYDTNGLLSLTGRTKTDETATITIDASNRADFLGWISAVMHEADMAAPESRRAFEATAVGLTTHGDSSGFSVSFTFEIIGGGRMRFVVPVAARSKTRLLAIQGHLDQALREMANPDSPASQ
jgi:hypothetical protein